MYRIVNSKLLILLLVFITNLNSATEQQSLEEAAEAKTASHSLINQEFIKDKRMISFSGTGVELSHMFGVALWIFEQGISKQEDVCCIGASGGSLTSAILASGIELSKEKMLGWLHDLMEISLYNVMHIFHSDEILKNSKLLKDLGEIENLPKKVSEKLVIALSEHPISCYQASSNDYDVLPLETCFFGISNAGIFKHRNICAWDSQEDLFTCLRASCFLPWTNIGYSMPYWGNSYYSGSYYFDGGYSTPNAQPLPAHVSKALVKVNPYFTGEYPRLWLIEQLMFIKPWSWHVKNFEKGYKEAADLHENGYWNAVLPLQSH